MQCQQTKMPRSGYAEGTVRRKLSCWTAALILCVCYAVNDVSAQHYSKTAVQEVLRLLHGNVDANVPAVPKWWTLEELKRRLHEMYRELGETVTSSTLIKPTQYQGGPLMDTDCIVIVGMASGQEYERHHGYHPYMGKGLSPFVLFAEEEEPEGLVTLPQLQGRTSHEDAQHRQLQGVQWLYHHQFNTLSAEWVFLLACIVHTPYTKH